MARLQIVALPSLTVGSVSQPEYLIVIDEAGDSSEPLAADLLRLQGKVREMTGTRGVLVFETRVEVVRESSEHAHLTTEVAEALALVADLQTGLVAALAANERLRAELPEPEAFHTHLNRML